MANFCPNLKVRNKWWKPREDVKIDDIALIINPDVSRGKWNMGKVIETFVGDDKRVRSVRIKTSGNYDRPITKLSLLLSKQEYESNK